MLEAIVFSGPKVKIVNSHVPKPGPNQVLVKVAVAAANPKDWCVHRVSNPTKADI